MLLRLKSYGLWQKGNGSQSSGRWMGDGLAVELEKIGNQLV
jgi:hypothetical protein